MTYRELYKDVTAKLERAGCDSPSFDAGCLLSHIAGIKHGMLPLRGGETVNPDISIRLSDAAEQRAQGRPLQYILGSWDFLSLTLEVGEGVLIPRADTELLCETAVDKTIGAENPKVLDLCSGSGCVALGFASLCRSAEVTAIELSEQAMEYLRRNCARYPYLNVKAVQADVLKDSDKFDRMYNVILSNPPYIPIEDLNNLMREVKHEPEMALDGGDGYMFYRSIARSWLTKLVDGGICAVEVGIGQAAEVAAMFSHAGLRDIEIYRDLGGIERVVIGKKR